MVNFDPLWETMKKRNVTTYHLIKDHDFSKGTLDSLKHNRNVTLHTIERLCTILQAPIEEIVRIDFMKKDNQKKV